MGEILVILAVLVLLFGAKKIPEIARSLGKSLGEFKKGRQEGGLDSTREDDDAAKPKPPEA
ncbi:MAG: twin-arginine translocase TatA/TatE family subunit [Lentisphaerota bacterium]